MELVIKERANGVIIAQGSESDSVRIFEGAWYFPPESVKMEHLKISERTYTCPYKGMCYWIDLEMPDGRMARNVAWVYREPKPDYEFIQGQIGFYARATAGTMPEKTDSHDTVNEQEQ